MINNVTLWFWSIGDVEGSFDPPGVMMEVLAYFG